MNFTGIVRFVVMVGLEKVDLKAIKSETEYVGEGVQEENRRKAQQAEVRKSGTQFKRQKTEENRSLIALTTGQSNSIVLEHGKSPLDDSGISFASTICPAPLCRQFWKAGNYDDGLNSKTTLQSMQSIIFAVLLLYSLFCLTSWMVVSFAIRGSISFQCCLYSKSHSPSCSF